MRNSQVRSDDWPRNGADGAEDAQEHFLRQVERLVAVAEQVDTPAGRPSAGAAATSSAHAASSPAAQRCTSSASSVPTSVHPRARASFTGVLASARAIDSLPPAAGAVSAATRIRTRRSAKGSRRGCYHGLRGVRMGLAAGPRGQPDARRRARRWPSCRCATSGSTQRLVLAGDAALGAADLSARDRGLHRRHHPPGRFDGRPPEARTRLPAARRARGGAARPAAGLGTRPVARRGSSSGRATSTPASGATPGRPSATSRASRSTTARPRSSTSSAVARYREGRAGAAIDPLRRAIALAPGLAEAHYLLGVSLRDAGRLDEAAVGARRGGPAVAGPARGPRGPGRRATRRAATSRRRGRRTDALAALEPERAERAVAVGAAYARAGRHDAAVLALGRAAERFPQSSAVFAALGAVWLRAAEDRRSGGARQGAGRAGARRGARRAERRDVDAARPRPRPGAAISTAPSATCAEPSSACRRRPRPSPGSPTCSNAASRWAEARDALVEYAALASGTRGGRRRRAAHRRACRCASAIRTARRTGTRRPIAESGPSAPLLHRLRRGRARSRRRPAAPGAGRGGPGARARPRRPAGAGPHARPAADGRPRHDVARPDAAPGRWPSRRAAPDAPISLASPWRVTPSSRAAATGPLAAARQRRPHVGGLERPAGGVERQRRRRRAAAAPHVGATSSARTSPRARRRAPRCRDGVLQLAGVARPVVRRQGRQQRRRQLGAATRCARRSPARSARRARGMSSRRSRSGGTRRRTTSSRKRRSARNRPARDLARAAAGWWPPPAARRCAAPRSRRGAAARLPAARAAAWPGRAATARRPRRGRACRRGPPRTARGARRPRR